MAGKRYQVFVSSTFRDLKKERWEAFKALITMDCIVAGMEYFPAVDEEQFKYIKEIIDDCDYYLLILGGRYGTLAPDGVSYTEKEYDYALSKGIKKVALIHGAPEQLRPPKRELEAEQISRFEKFREKVCTGRHVAFWHNKKDLAGKVALSMHTAIKKFPAIGWIRNATVKNRDFYFFSDLLYHYNDRLTVRYGIDEDYSKYIEIDLLDIFKVISRCLYSKKTFEDLIKLFYNYIFYNHQNVHMYNFYDSKLHYVDFNSALQSLLQLGLIKLENDYYSLTEIGKLYHKSIPT